MGKQKIIPVLAMVLLLIGVISALYVNAIQINKDTITIKGQEYTYADLFLLGGEKTIKTVDGEVTGASLENIIKSIGVFCTSCSKYTIKAADGYEKTIEWNVLKTGVLSKENRVYFPDTPKAFWVRDVVEIEVN
jgi:hypothetical protein